MFHREPFKQVKIAPNNLLGANNINESCLFAILGVSTFKVTNNFYSICTIVKTLCRVHNARSAEPMPYRAKMCIFGEIPTSCTGIARENVREHLLPCHLAKKHKYLCQLLCSCARLPFSCFWGIFRAEVRKHFPASLYARHPMNLSNCKQNCQNFPFFIRCLRLFCASFLRFVCFANICLALSAPRSFYDREKDASGNVGEPKWWSWYFGVTLVSGC